MEEQRISKTIALAVFSSDALSSTAYATEEILFVVAVGASSLALGLEHARADRDRRRRPARDRDRLVPAGDLRLSRRRRRVRREQENIGEMAALVAGASLMVDYVLTVAVSISAGVAAIISIPQFEGLARASRRARRRAHRAHHADEHARHEGVGPDLRRSPRTSTCSSSSSLIVYGLYRSYFGDIAPVPFDAKLFDGLNRVRRHARRLLAAEGLLVGRGRAHGRRGDLERRARVPAARGEERGDDARVDGRAARQLVLRHLGARAPAPAVPEPRPHGDRAARPRRCSGTGRCSCCCSSRPPRSSCSPRTPPTTGSRACRRSSPRTATSRASSRTAATGSCSRTGSSCSPAPRRCC